MTKLEFIFVICYKSKEENLNLTTKPLSIIVWNTLLSFLSLKKEDSGPKICLTRHNLRTNLTKNFLKYPLKPHGSDTSVKKAKMNTTNSENNFHFIFENNITKTVSVSITTLLILFAGPLYYAIIWYERFGTNTKRTLINQVHSQNCRVYLPICF